MRPVPYQIRRPRSTADGNRTRAYRGEGPAAAIQRSTAVWYMTDFMWLHPRLEISGPQFPAEHREGFEPIRWFTIWRGHGSDEYGNCSWYFTTALPGGVIFFWDPHFQRDVELPSDSDATAEDWRRWYDRKFNREPAAPEGIEPSPPR
jgi:hypothetical protein